MSLLVEEYIRSLFMILEEGKLESDVYSNALSISYLIKKLHGDGNLSQFDVNVLNEIASGYSYSEVAKRLTVSRLKVTTSFKESCNRMSFILGGSFTDAGFIDRFRKRQR